MILDEIMAGDSAESSTNAPPKSFLIADCGHINTTVTLFDEAAGSYRLIARATVPTTAAEPWADVHLGIRQAIKQIAETTERKLLNESDNLIRPARSGGTGVDAFAATVSAAAPLNTLLVGLFDKVSLASARRVLRSTYAYESDKFTLSDTRSENEQIAAVLDHRPDLFLVAGGTDGGAEQSLLQLIETIQIGIKALSEIKRPHILFAGNKALRERLRMILGEQIHLHVADNVRPSLAAESLDDAIQLINDLYEAIKINALPGIQNIRKWSEYPVQSTCQALADITRYFAAVQNGRVLAVDLGSHSVTLADAAPNRNSRLYVRTNLGMGRPIANILDEVPLSAISRWLPAAIDEGEIHNVIRNKALYPQTVPFTQAELSLEQAAAREILGCVAGEAMACWGDMPSDQTAPLRLLLVHGRSLTTYPRPSQALLVLLDTLQPAGIFSVALDTYGVLPALGVLAAHEPLAAVQALESDVLLNLGWVVAPTGKGQPGQKVVNIILEAEQTRRLEVEVEYGTIEVLPLAAGQSARVTLQPARRIDAGFGPGRGQTVTISGGAVGLVVDARGRPLNLPSDDEERQTLLHQWLWDIGG